MFKRGDIARAHMWTGTYAEFNGEGVRVIGGLRRRNARKGDGSTHELDAYEVLAPSGERLICAPRNLIPIFEPLYRFRIDLDKVSWADCDWQPEELRDGDAEDGLGEHDKP